MGRPTGSGARSALILFFIWPALAVVFNFHPLGLAGTNVAFAYIWPVLLGGVLMAAMGRRLVRLSPLDRYAIVFYLGVLVQVGVLAAARGDAFLQAYRVWFGLLRAEIFLFFVVEASDLAVLGDTARWYIWSTVVLMAGFAATGAFFQSGHYLSSGVERAGGFYGVPNAFSPVCVLLFAVAFWQYHRKPALRYAVAALIALVSLFLTFTRNGWLALVVFLSAWYYLARRVKSRGQPRRGWVALVAAALGLVLLAYSKRAYIAEQIAATVLRDVSLGDQGIGAGVLGTRFVFLVAQFQSYAGAPLLEKIFGQGYESLFLSLIRFVDPRQTFVAGTQFSAVENSYLYALFGGGVVAFAVVLLIHYRGIAASWRLYRRSGSLEESLYFRFSTALLLAYVPQMLLMDMLYTQLNIVFLYFFAGVALKLAVRTQAAERGLVEAAP